MKALLIFPRKYSLTEMLKNGFESNGWEVKIVDYENIIPYWWNRFYEKTLGLPDRFIKHAKIEYYKKINKKYLEYYENEKPEIIFIYNNQFVFPETLKIFKETSQIAFLLGDNPLFSHTFEYNLNILQYSDYTICADTYWRDQLISFGFRNVVFDMLGYDKNIFYKVDDIPKNIYEKYVSDILFIGTCYSGAEGHKRAMFYNSINIDNFKLYGTKGWLKILNEYPVIKRNFILLEDRISNEELNYAFNSTKIIPIEQNSGLINGIHLRVFESIGSGVLPIVEWTEDIDSVFNGLIPIVKSYKDLNKIIKYFLKNEKERNDRIKALREIIINKYRPDLFVERLIKNLFKV